MPFTKPTHIRLLRSARGAVAGFCLGALAIGGALAQTPEATPLPPSRNTDGPSHWQRQQPTRDRVHRLLREEGIAPSPQERRRELRTLNRIHRELMPPGTMVPAPGVGKRDPALPGK